MKTSICTQCGATFEWSPEFYRQKGIKAPPLRCPTCCDEQHGKDAHHTVVERECLQQFPCCDVSQALTRLPFTTVTEQDGQKIRPYRRATIKGRNFGASWAGRIDVFDQRTDPEAALAKVRVMRTAHQAGAQMTGVRVTGPRYPWYSRHTYQYEHSKEWEYVVLDDPEDDRPTCALVVATATQKWNRNDRIGGQPLWSCTAAGRSRTGKHSGVAVLAVVDDDHPLTVTRIHDKGALHKGDLFTIATASKPVVDTLLAKKASKPVERDITRYGSPE